MTTTMTQESIIEVFKDCVREVDTNVKLEGLGPKTELSALGLDSVMTMEVIGVLEEKLDVRFPDEDLATIKDLEDLTTVVRKLA